MCPDNEDFDVNRHIEIRDSESVLTLKDSPLPAFDLIRIPEGIPELLACTEPGTTALIQQVRDLKDLVHEECKQVHHIATQYPFRGISFTHSYT